jgi:alpha-beta hydrolase superfamily lysophospholipase
MIRWTAAVLTLVLMGGGPTHAAPPPLQAYASLPAVGGVVISPDGGHHAVVTTAGEQRIVKVYGRDGTLRRGLDISHLRLSYIDWADPKRVLIVTRIFHPGDRIVPAQELSRAMTFDVDTGATAFLFQGVERTVPVLAGRPVAGRHEGQPVVYVKGLRLPDKYGLFRLSPVTGGGIMYNQGSRESLDWLISPDGALLARSERRSDGTWLLKARRGEEWVEIARLQTRSPPPVVGLGPDGRSALVYRSPSDGPGLHIVDLRTGAWTPLIPPDRSVERFFFDPESGRLNALSLGGPQPELKSFSPAYDRLRAGIEQRFAGRGVEVVSISGDARRAVVRAWSGDHPGGFHLVDLEIDGSSPIGELYPAIPDDQIAPVRALSYAAADGLNIPARVVLPPGRAAKGLPLIVLEGGPAAGFNPIAQAFASRGYAVLTPRVRGDSTVSPVHSRAAEGEMGGKQVTDFADGVRHLAREGVIDPDRVCFVAAGEGGYTALAAVTVRPGPYRCTVALNPLADPKWEVARNSDVAGSGKVRFEVLMRQLGVTGVGDDRFDALSPVRQAAAAKAPVLLVHAEKDGRVPLDHSRRMHAALRSAGRSGELVIIEGADHSLSRQSDRLKFLQEAVRFVQTHNPPG